VSYKIYNTYIYTVTIVTLFCLWPKSGVPIQEENEALLAAET